MNSTNIIPPFTNIVDPGGVVVKLELELSKPEKQQEDLHLAEAATAPKSKPCLQRQDSEENISLGTLSNGHRSSSFLEQECPTIDSIPSTTASPISSAPICRQFWKAGNYDEGLASKSMLQNATGYLHIHPKFLHSNATSHKWAFGAIAELLDNAVDEVQRGATLVALDKMSNPRDGNPALLIQDDGGGMDPDAMRRCLSFGFSDKKSKSAIGRYGNGFKTSTMRLGADAIVFSRSTKERKLTQSVGLLSYTFLMQSGHDRIVVPMVDYEYDPSTGTWKTLQAEQHFVKNISLLLRWSPYSTESEILNQLEAIGSHGMRIIIYNLWCNDDGQMELDFDSDPEDICVHGGKTENEKSGSRTTLTDQHLANRLRYSLRAYLSILYLRIPNNFSMLLRGRVIEYHNVADGLKYPEFILYKPLSSGNVEGSVVTTIGFLKEAPLVNIHGFNVYHKNRLVLPFWHVVSYSDSRGRGVVGVLEANFIEPTHNKQEFEKTPVFQKLEQRLKEMTWEYWDYHCGLMVIKSPSAVPTPSSDTKIDQNQVLMLPQTQSRSKRLSNVQSNSQGAPKKNRERGNWKTKSRSGSDESIPGSQTEVYVYLCSDFHCLDML
ncbi:hypothetical protein LIER_07365 [Lithospermum erythrorhizon]|uniref:Morc S5 domain-containing protein n=1 Tax=Lithospermum erythrorhizon TaxID=34254 RepID=A0AAV3PC48_LITER